MSLAWIRESPPSWDREKAAILGAAPAGVFDFSRYRPGDLLPGDWWRVDRDREIAGYGWLDCNWGDGEILLAVAPRFQRHGIGGFILDALQKEAQVRGIYYLHNVVPAGHPDRAGLHRWLEAHGFADRGDGRLMRAVVPRPTDSRSNKMFDPSQGD